MKKKIQRLAIKWGYFLLFAFMVFTASVMSVQYDEVKWWALPTIVGLIGLVVFWRKEPSKPLG